MTLSETINLLTEIITDHLEKPIVLSAKELHFLSSTFSVTTSAELVKMALNDTGDDIGLFFEMAVQPCFEIRKKIEPAIWDKTLSETDENNLIKNVRNRIKELVFSVHDNEAPAKLGIQSAFIDNYIKKLHIFRTIPQSLLDNMDMFLALHVKTETCVKLRCSEIPLSNDNVLEFLKSIIENYACFGDDFLNHFELVLELISSSDNGRSLFFSFEKSLHHLIKIKNRIRDAREMMEKNSMETLMMKGFVIPPQSPEETEKRITMTKRIIMCVYKRNLTEETPVSEINVESSDETLAYSKVSRLLS